jgi:hypothetical protein
MLLSGTVRYLEFDASFLALHPYCYLVPHAVVRNYGIPPCLVITASEHEASYDLFSRSMMTIDNELVMLEPSIEAEGSEASEWMFLRQVPRTLLTLSYAETEMAAFAKNHGMRHSLCFRRMLENLGTKACIAGLARCLLFSSTKREYQELRVITLRKFLYAYRVKGAITDQAQPQFSKLPGLTQNDEGG